MFRARIRQSQSGAIVEHEERQLLRILFEPDVHAARGIADGIVQRRFERQIDQIFVERGRALVLYRRSDPDLVLGDIHLDGMAMLAAHRHRLAAGDHVLEEIVQLHLGEVGFQTGMFVLVEGEETDQAVLQFDAALVGLARLFRRMRDDG